MGEKDVDRRADVFALGIVLWEMLARRALFEGDTFSMLTRMSTDAPVRAQRAPGGLARLDAIVVRALRRDADERYATAAEMRADSKLFLRGHDPAQLDRQLAHIMNDLFAETRDSVRARIKAFVSTADEGLAVARLMHSGELPVLLSDSNPVQSFPVAPLGGMNVGSSPPTASALAIASSPPTASALKPLIRRRPGLVLSLVALALAMATVGVVALTRAAPPASATPVVASAASVHVHLEFIPPGARRAYGYPLDRTPADLTLEPGPQTLIVSREGYETAMVVVDAKAGERLTRLQTLDAKALVAAAPPVPTAPRPSRASPSRTPRRSAASSLPGAPLLRVPRPRRRRRPPARPQRPGRRARRARGSRCSTTPALSERVKTAG